MQSCKNNSVNNRITLGWMDGKASSVTIPWNRLPVKDKDSAIAYTRIRLEYSNTDILGAYEIKDGLVFVPLLPFTHGETYRIFYQRTGIGSFTVPASTSAPPELLAIYPTTDTVPVNLLKIYLAFSQPMQENVSAEMVHMISNKDTMKNVFLDLQPELWNKDRTVLTLWLDPGRIKRELQPNERLGAPLEQHSHYQVYVSPQWKNTQGVSLRQAFTKEMITSVRDSLSPGLQQWTLDLPEVGKTTPLTVQLNEALDHFLLLETITIQTADGKNIRGNTSTGNNDRTVYFTPADPWRAGKYQMVVASKLEDPAGNNLNRPFDRDLLSGKASTPREFFSRDFSIE